MSDTTADPIKREFLRLVETKAETWRPERRPLLYGISRLEGAPKGELVYIVDEGTKVDVLAAWNLIAVCPEADAAGTWPEKLSHIFTGRRVVILPTNDDLGRKYTAHVAACMEPFAASIQIVRLPGLPEKGDLIDWINLQKGVVNE